MSRGTVVSRRYAKALFQLAEEQGLVAEAETQLRLIVGAIEGDADMKAFLAAPNIAPEAKRNTLAAAFGGEVAPIVLNLVNLLIDRGREGEFSSVLEAYLQVAGERLKRADAVVTSAQPLSAPEQEKLAQRFGAALGLTIRVTNQVNPQLLGGVTVRIGDTLYDGSLSGKLERLNKALQTAAI